MVATNKYQHFPHSNLPVFSFHVFFYIFSCFSFFYEKLIYFCASFEKMYANFCHVYFHFRQIFNWYNSKETEHVGVNFPEDNTKNPLIQSNNVGRLKFKHFVDTKQL